MPSPLYLGVDVGTSATRVSLVGESGAQVASAGYPTARGAAGHVEQDPLAWSGALAAALRQTGADLCAVAAVGLCGQTPTLVLVDAAGAPVRPALTWQDTRATAEAAELEARFGDPEPLIGTALPWSAANMPAKLLWLARHEPATRARTRWLLQPKDLLGLQLTGSPASDPWSSKGLCRVSDCAPAAEVLAACGWSADACPPIAAAWEPRGTVTAAAAERFGLPAGIPVSVGWSDALAQTLAAGCYQRGSGFVFSGTSAIVGAPVTGEDRRAAGLFSVPGSCAPAPLLYGPTQASGASVAWVARLLGCRPGDVPALAASLGPGYPGLRALPVRGACAAVEHRGPGTAAGPGRRPRAGRGREGRAGGHLAERPACAGRGGERDGGAGARDRVRRARGRRPDLGSPGPGNAWAPGSASTRTRRCRRAVRRSSPR